MENKLIKKVGGVYFLIVAVMMYFFITETINVGLYITFRHVFALVLAVSAVIAFLLKPNVARGATLVKSSLVYSAPMAVIFGISLFIWFMGRVDVSVISRGLSSSLVYTNMLSFTLAATAFLYIFGEKGIWYNLIAILISNLIMICKIILNYGLPGFISEFITLIVTFAGETGEIIVKAEIHELAFCLGAYLIYMLLKPRKNVVFWILLGFAGFCFLVAFKRIGIIAVGFALVLGWILQFVAKFKKEVATRLAVILSLAMVVVMIGYVAIIRMGVFTLLEEAGIETSGRVKVYNAVEKFYEFSPDFLGNGIGFLTYQLSTNMKLGVTAVHNDFLQHYIDLGFWGYILWLVSMITFRVCYFGSKGKTENAIIAFALSVYLVVVSSTDNTMNYPLLTTVLAIIMIGHGCDEEVRRTERKIFGSVSKTNQKTEDGAML